VAVSRWESIGSYRSGLRAAWEPTHVCCQSCSCVYWCFRKYCHSNAMTSSPAVDSLKRQFDDVTKCPICLDEFTDPRLLPCVHTYCFRCIREWFKVRHVGDRTPCPLCRNDFDITEQGLDNLPKNISVVKATTDNDQLRGEQYWGGAVYWGVSRKSCTFVSITALDQHYINIYKFVVTARCLLLFLTHQKPSF